MRWILVATVLVLPAYAQEEPAEPAEPAPAEAEASATGEAPLETVPVQDAAKPDEVAEDSVALDAIEVTAQRRKERLVDVPVAVTAITQDQVQARGLGRLDDLNSVAPGLQVSRSPSNTTISQLTIRGSSQINPAIYWDPAVGVYLDGVYIGKGQGAIFDIVDLAGIEVLRGPQGTLYGRNTIAGTINFVTREPSGQFNGNAALDYGTFNGRVMRATMDLPRFWLADLTVGVRSERRDPWITTTQTSPVDGMNNRHNDGAHVGALLSITDGVEAMYHLDWSEIDQTNNFLQLYRSDDPMLQPYVSKERRDTADINAPTGELADILGHSLAVTWDINDSLTFKSTSGMRDVIWVDKLDLDGTPNDTAHSERHTDYSQLSQDLNLSGRYGKWTYTGGAYYFEDDGYTVNPIYVVLSGAPLQFDSRYGTQAEAWAGYGQVAWQPLDPLTVTAGARYTTEQKELDRVYGFRSPPPAPLPAPPYTYYMPEGYRAPGAKFTATTPMASVAWRFTDSLNTYVRYAEGFKSGGFNGEYSNIGGTEEENQRETDTPFKPEKQKSIELGAKSSFFGGRALLNVAAFQNKLDDLQVSIFVASGAAASIIRNAGKATVQGLEIETAFVPIEGTSLRLNYAFLDPRYDEFLDNVCDDAGNCPQKNVADNRAFVHAPETSWNAVIDSELWQTSWGTLRGVVDYVWTDAFYTYPYQLKPDPNMVPTQQQQEAENTKVPAYGVLNARLTFVAIPLGGNRLGEVALVGRNVLDEDSVNNFIDFGPSFQNLTVVNFVEPATFALSAALRF
jgi:iron complex outermembrane recepter protein